MVFSMNRQRVAIDITSMHVTGAGTATYVRELMKSMTLLDGIAEMYPIDYRNFFSRKYKLSRSIDTIGRELVWQQFILPSLAVKHGARILHSPAMISPLRCPIPVVLTLLDAYIVRSPNSFSVWQRTVANHLLPRCIERADKLIAISHFTKREILDLYPHIPEDRITVTWLGVSPDFRVLDEQAGMAARVKYKLDRPFILSVSTIEPRKNIRMLIQAFARIKERIDHDLVLTGAYGWKSKDLYRLISDLGLGGRIKFTGYVPLEDLPAIYNLADLFVYPSLYEGFGLPPLEAMACGCPVITSNVASLPEVVGDAAVMVDPLDTEQISASILNLLLDAGRCSLLKSAGIIQAAKFTWASCARQTLDVYGELWS